MKMVCITKINIQNREASLISATIGNHHLTTGLQIIMKNISDSFNMTIGNTR